MKIIVKEDNTEKFINASEEAIVKALETCGFQAERNAKKNLYANHGVDTGLLRNSITFAIDGETVNGPSYKADKGGKTGSYTGAAPKEGDGKRAVLIGTNVEYAPYVETGTSRMSAIPFLKPAITEHQGEYKAIIQKELKNA